MGVLRISLPRVIRAALARLLTWRSEKEPGRVVVTHNRAYALKIWIKRGWWLPLFSDQWFLPRFHVKLLNDLGAIKEGIVHCEIAECPEHLSTITHLQTWQSVYSYPLRDFETGDRRKFAFTVAARYLRPKPYVVRLQVHHNLAIENYDEWQRWTTAWLVQHLDEPGRSAMYNNIIQRGQESLRSLGVDPENVRAHRTEHIIDWYWPEPFKVHPLRDVVTVFTAPFAVAAAAAGILRAIGVIP